MNYIPHDKITYPGFVVQSPIIPGWYPTTSPILQREPLYEKLIYHVHVRVEHALGFDQTAVTRAHNRVCREIEE
jgi:hypothetical protein